MPKPAAYISFAEADRRTATALQQAIARRGVPCTLSPLVESAAALDAAAKDAIANSKVFVLVYTRHANSSARVAFELAFASQREIPVLPIRFDDAPMSQELEFYLSAYHWLDAIGKPPEAVIDEAVTRVSRLLHRRSDDSAFKRIAIDAPGARDVRRPRVRVFSAGNVFKWVTALTLTAGSIGFAYEYNLPDSRIKEWLRPSGEEAIVRLPNRATIEFIWCAPGTYTMGAPSSELEWESARAKQMGGPEYEPMGFQDETQHHVTITKGFWLAKFEVTRALWKSVMESSPGGPGTHPLSPVGDVSWSDCQVFITKLNEMTDGSFRLPTEAEWEYACRAGASTMYHFGGPEDIERARPMPSTRGPIWQGGLFEPNAWGFHDMDWNVAEWCKDWYGPYPTGPVTDPTGPGEGVFRVLRGGYDADFVLPDRCAKRRRLPERKSNGRTGLRLCCSYLPP